MSVELLNKRLRYHGGNQEGRFINDKLRGLKQALLYSYQAATAILSDGREFRCLINPDKNKPAYDNKIISIPFKDICLNAMRTGKRTQGQVEIGMKPGDVFEWKQTSTHWLVYLNYLQQDAYFRADIRRCDQKIDINNKQYWVYIRGPVETAIEWSQKKKVEWNSLNYSLVMYITADEFTNNYFERFKKVKVLDPRYNIEKTWQVAGVDPYYGDGILQIFLDEFFENEFEEEQMENSSNENPEGDVVYIDGPTQVKQYSKAYFRIENATGGEWYLLWKDEQLDLKYNKDILPLNISLGDLGTFTLIYRIEGQEDITLDVTIVSL